MGSSCWLVFVVVFVASFFCSTMNLLRLQYGKAAWYWLVPIIIICFLFVNTTTDPIQCCFSDEMDFLSRWFVHMWSIKWNKNYTKYCIVIGACFWTRYNWDIIINRLIIIFFFDFVLQDDRMVTNIWNYWKTIFRHKNELIWFQN